MRVAIARFAVMMICAAALGACSVNIGILPSRGIHIPHVAGREYSEAIGIVTRVALAHGLEVGGIGTKDADYHKPNRSLFGHFLVSNVLYVEVGPNSRGGLDIVVSSSGHVFSEAGQQLFGDLAPAIKQKFPHAVVDPAKPVQAHAMGRIHLRLVVACSPTTPKSDRARFSVYQPDNDDGMFVLAEMVRLRLVRFDDNGFRLSPE